jgi:hypothetical protein
MGNTHRGSDIFPMLENNTGKILVLPEYPDVVKRIIKIYTLKPRRGVLITGQPGIGTWSWSLSFRLLKPFFTGKSVLLAYLLLVLMSLTEKEDADTKLTSAPIFFYSRYAKDSVLFYDDVAYQPTGNRPDWISHLPTPKWLPDGQFGPNGNRGLPVWVLVDFRGLPAEEPEGLGAMNPHAFLVHSSSPNPVRYQTWLTSKTNIETTPVVVGLSLWTSDLLHLG